MLHVYAQRIQIELARSTSKELEDGFVYTLHLCRRYVVSIVLRRYLKYRHTDCRHSIEEYKRTIVSYMEALRLRYASLRAFAALLLLVPMA